MINLHAWNLLCLATVNALQGFLTLTQSGDKVATGNETVLRLHNLKTWWDSLSSGDKIQQRNVTYLVDATEELVGAWISSSLSALKASADDDDDDDSNKSREED